MKYKLIYLEWADAVMNKGWFHEEDLEDWIENSNWVIKEVGWLLKETKEYMIFATGITEGDKFTGKQFLTLHKIPKTWIRKRKEIKV